MGYNPRPGKFDPTRVEKVPPRQITELPYHLFLPQDAQAVDFREIGDVTAGSRELLIDFTVPRGKLFQVIKYGIFNDGLAAADFDFFPKVDGRRVYKFQGSTINRSGGMPRIYLGLAPDLSNSSLIDGQLVVRENQRLTWEAENRSGVDVTMGVRVVGYLTAADKQQLRHGG